MRKVRRQYLQKFLQEAGGVDSYANAISDTYQDNFGEGIYTGKGIYDLKVFNNVMKDRIPENTILSHDLLEGCYLRCGLVSDIMLLDGFPKGYISFLTRISRWIRGDYQILGYLKQESNLSKLSKFKIIDNIRRSLLEITVISNIMFLLILKMFFNVKITFGIILMILSIVIPSLLEFFCYIIFRKENVKKQRKFTKRIEGLEGSFYRAFIEVITLPTKAYISLCSAVKTIYRMTVTKEHLLEWTTSEDAEKQDKNNIKAVLKKMMPNIIFGLALLIIAAISYCNIYYRVFIYVFSALILVAPFIMWQISKDKMHVNKIDKLGKDDKIYIRNVAEKTWQYFAEFMNKENSYLPPDNFQESRREKVVFRTSSTNIGLGLLTVISAYDLKFITLENAIVTLENIIETIEKLEKWNGHLYNWYNTKTLDPLIPKYVSTVDSGNFIRIYVYIKDVFRGKGKYCI